MVNTPKQEDFVAAYVETLDIKVSAERAGLSYDYARRLVTKSHIKEAIAERRRKAQERTEITTDTVLEGLLREAQGEGPDTHTTARVSAWEKLGKYLGLFGPKGTEDDPIHHKSMTWTEPPDDAPSLRTSDHDPAK